MFFQIIVIITTIYKTLILMAANTLNLSKTLNIMAANISGFTVTIKQYSFHSRWGELDM